MILGYALAGVNLPQMFLTGLVVQAKPRPLTLVPLRDTPANQVCILYFYLKLVYIPFTNRLRGPYYKLQARFFSLRFMAQIYSTGRVSEVGKMFTISLSEIFYFLTQVVFIELAFPWLPLSLIQQLEGINSKVWDIFCFSHFLSVQALILYLDFMVLF